eukprot:763996-Hanusia_phi.AAC.14
MFPSKHPPASAPRLPVLVNAMFLFSQRFSLRQAGSAQPGVTPRWGGVVRPGYEPAISDMPMPLAAAMTLLANQGQ